MTCTAYFEVHPSCFVALSAGVFIIECRLGERILTAAGVEHDPPSPGDLNHYGVHIVKYLLTDERKSKEDMQQLAVSFKGKYLFGVSEARTAQSSTCGPAHNVCLPESALVKRSTDPAIRAVVSPEEFKRMCTCGSPAVGRRPCIHVRAVIRACLERTHPIHIQCKLLYDIRLLQSTVNELYGLMDHCVVPAVHNVHLTPDAAQVYPPVWVRLQDAAAERVAGGDGAVLGSMPRLHYVTRMVPFKSGSAALSHTGADSTQLVCDDEITGSSSKRPRTVSRDVAARQLSVGEAALSAIEERKRAAQFASALATVTANAHFADDNLGSPGPRPLSQAMSGDRLGLAQVKSSSPVRSYCCSVCGQTGHNKKEGRRRREKEGR
jgi:hypothetical protein